MTTHTTSSVAPLTPSEAAEELLKRRAARRHLLPFTTYTKPSYEIKWFHVAAANVLNDVVRGLLPKYDPDYLPDAPKRVIFNMPPRNGKSELASRRLPAYAFGRIPDLEIIATSYGADLATMINRDVQQIIDSAEYRRLFPDTALNSSNVRSVAYGQPLRNSDIFEIVGSGGRYKSAGVGGAITGMGMTLGIVDDPVKNRDEAESEVYREKIWQWFSSTFYTRQLPNAAIVIMMTRWHDDDLVGRLLELEKNDSKADRWLVLDFPAIRDIEPNAETEPHAYEARKLDPRALGEVLWPERYPIEILDTMRALNPDDFEALQQQRPIKPGGTLFPKDKFKIIEQIIVFDDWEIVRYWDKAATADGGAYTAGVLMAFDPQARFGVNFIVLDVQRVQYDPFARETLIKQTAQLDTVRFRGDPLRFTIWIEQEPGSGGKESALNTIRNTLAGYSVEAEAVTGEKSVRWKPYSAQVKAGNVGIVAAEFTQVYINELSRLPAGKYKDQADASGGAFNKLSIGWYEDVIAVVDLPVQISPY